MAAIAFPTPLHRLATEVVSDFFSQEKQIDTILLVNSLARGKATVESDIDFAILVSNKIHPDEIRIVEQRWQTFSSHHPILREYKHSHPFAQIHLDIIDGVYMPTTWDDGGGPDYFEVMIGNQLLYSVPLWGEGAYFIQLKSKWLPFYNKPLQAQRLQMVMQACTYDLAHIPFFVKRGLYFQAFDRLYKAFQEFLQALFIQHGHYPIAYNKWIREQIEDILALPELYAELTRVIAINHLESEEVNEKADTLKRLLEQYIKN
jgi:predicted nucleotidyltransferase